LTTTDLLDLTAPSRASTFRLDVLDADRTPIGTLQASEDQPPTVANDVSRTIKRTLTGLQLPAAELGDLNPFTDLIRPSMVLEDGTVWSLGVFAFADLSRTPDTPGRGYDATLVDLLSILDRETETGVTLAKGDDISAFLVALTADANVLAVAIPARAGTAGADLSWPAGTSRLAIATAASRLCGFVDPYCDNDGTLTMGPLREAGALPDVTYGVGGRVFHSTIVESDDLLSAPNRYIVVDTAPTAAPIVVVYDLPVERPNSAAKRGFVIPTRIEVQGIANVDAALELARAAADVAGYRHLSFAGAPDPRHDTYSTVEFNGVVWREQAWSMTLADGTDMTHHLRSP